MTRIVAAVVVSAMLIALATTVISFAQTKPDSQVAAPPTYRPGLGDLMTMTVQPRHIKLALAGREKNWRYAAYEHHQLEEAFDLVARYWPQWRDFPIADMMNSVTKEPMTMLSQAIKSGSADQYKVAYARLTDGCNACHQGTNVGANVIVVPDASTFPDQDFRPAKP